MSELQASGWKRPLKAQLKRLHAWWAQTFRSYDAVDLSTALRGLGVKAGDAVMLHSSFSAANGFRGTPSDLIDVFLQTVGADGHLLMVSLPYRNAALDWLEGGRRFDVRKTPSMMGIVSELFRRRSGVLRSAHPTHPVLVHGPRGRSFVEAHPHCLFPCGPGSPFDAFARADGIVVFFNVPIDTFTFFHYLEHVVSPRLPFALYTDAPFAVEVVDQDGRSRTVRTHAFAREAIRRRRPERLYDALWQRGSVREQRVGATRLLAVRVRDALACTEEMLARGEYFYETGELGTASDPTASERARGRLEP